MKPKLLELIRQYGLARNAEGRHNNERDGIRVERARCRADSCLNEITAILDAQQAARAALALAKDKEVTP